MGANPVLRRLGFGPTDRVVIFHADDMGMAQCTVEAYAELLEFGVMSAAATMTPCPWFPATAALCRQPGVQERVDMGVHLTLNSEWRAFRWGPISTVDRASGLIDEEGYFHRSTAVLQQMADPAAVQVELEAQIEQALAAGIDATHIDSHMFGLFHPKFLPIYFDLARRYRLPAFMVRGDVGRLRTVGFDDETAEMMTGLVRQAEGDGLPLFDSVTVMPLEAVEDREAHARQVLAGLPAGVTAFVIHPCTDTAELRAMAADWPARVGDYCLFLSGTWRDAIRQSGVHVIGYHALRELMR